MNLRGICAAALALLLAGAAHGQEEAVTPQTLVDRAEIGDLLTRYYYNLGHGSTDSYAGYYTDDAEFVLNGKSYKGKDGIDNAYKDARKARPGPKPFSFNVSLSNPLILVHGETATAELIFTEIAIDTEGATPHLLAQGREYDNFVKQAGKWRIERRQIMEGAQVPPDWHG